MLSEEYYNKNGRLSHRGLALGFCEYSSSPYLTTRLSKIGKGYEVRIVNREGEHIETHGFYRLGCARKLIQGLLSIKL